MAALGVVLTPESQAYLDGQRQAVDAPFEVLWSNRRAVSAFLANQTQWDLAPMGGRVGLRHASVRGYLAEECGYGRKRIADTMDRVRLIEVSALDEWHSQYEADKARRGKR